MLTSLKNAKRAIGLGIALIATVVLVPAMANFQSINAIVNTHYTVIKSPIEGALDGFSKMPGRWDWRFRRMVGIGYRRPRAGTGGTGAP